MTEKQIIESLRELITNLSDKIDKYDKATDDLINEVDNTDPDHLEHDCVLFDAVETLRKIRKSS